MTVRRPQPGKKFIKRQTERFLRRAPTVENAAWVIVTMTSLVVVVGAVAMRLFDHKEFPNIWVSLWWALQTATTVGYGDVVPHDTVGRLVGAVVMLEGIAFLAIVTAAITSTFVARAQRELAMTHEPDWQDLAARLERIEASLERITPIERRPDADDALKSGNR